MDGFKKLLIVLRVLKSLRLGGDVHGLMCKLQLVNVGYFKRRT